jgi:hypothetical protein
MSANWEEVGMVGAATGLTDVESALWGHLGFTRSNAWPQLCRIVLGVLTPQALFFLGLRQGGIATGLAASAAWTLGLLIYDLMRGGGMQPVALYGLVFTAAQGALVLWTRNATIYAAGGAVENLLTGLLLIGSAIICRPLLVEALGGMIPGCHPSVLSGPARAALGRLTILWGLALLVRAAGLFAALTHLSLGQFMVVNTLATWPLNGVGLFASVAYLRVQLR